MDNCIFCKIRDGEVPKEFTYQDEDIMVFPDISPIKPIHLLVIPKKHLHDVMELEPVLSGKVMTIIQRMVRQHQLTDKGFRLVVNGGGAQEVDHLHFHITGPWGSSVKN